MGPSEAQDGLKLGQVGLKLASEGDLDVILPSCARLGGNLADKMATQAASERQDAVLEASWSALGRSLGGPGRSWGGPGAFLGNKPLRGGVNPGVKGAALRNARAP